MPEPTRRRVTALLADVVGSSAEMERIGNVAGSAAITSRLDALASALLAVDPTATRAPVEGGDSILILGDHNASTAAALVFAAVAHQEQGSLWAFKVRIAIGEGDVVENDQHHGQMLNRIGKLLKHACWPGEVVTTEAVRDAVAAEGKANSLRSASVMLPGVGETAYWFVGARGYMPRDDEEAQRSTSRTLEAIQQRLQMLERATEDCDRLARDAKENIKAQQANLERLDKMVRRLVWSSVFILMGSLGAGLILAVILLAVNGRRVDRAGLVAPAIAETLPGGGDTSR